MKGKKSTEDYLKTIYLLDVQAGVHGKDIAEKMSISRPSVSIALKALEQDGHVWMDEQRLVHLTAKGLEIARATYERNRFFQELLLHLGVDEEIAARDACELEHSISPESFAAIRAAWEKGRDTPG